MHPITKPVVYFAAAALFATCGCLSWLFSPMLIWKFFTETGDMWRWELLRPQMNRVPVGTYLLGSLSLWALAILVCLGVKKFHGRWKTIPIWGCVVGALTGGVYWILHGSFL